MPANRGRGVDGRLNAWLTLFEARSDLRSATNSEFVERAFTSRYATREGTDHLGLFNAAKFFGLDQQNPAHRTLLLYILAEVIFTKAPKGRPKATAAWDKNKLFSLGARAADLKKKKTGSLTGKRAAEELKKQFDSDYRHTSVETIRQRLPAAQQVLEETRKLFLSRMNELGLSFPEYIMLLAKEFPEHKEEYDRILRGIGPPVE
jgi:hypothetical protein